MVFPKQLWIIFAVCLVFSAVGFKRFVWFMSVGYGLSVAAAGLTILIMFHQTLGLAGILICLAVIAYGCRLGLFLLFRELRNANYRKKLAEATKTEKPIPFFVKIFMWVYVAFMYVMQTAPVFYRGFNGSSVNVWAWIGLAVMVLGAGIEALADKQKSAAKKIDPKRWASQGLYKIVRCPNYFGEMLFWTGVLLSGIGAVSGKQWILPLIGWVLIIYVMMAGARRMELRHEKSYGNNPEFQKYAKTVPLVLPLIPLYSLKKQTWLKG